MLIDPAPPPPHAYLVLVNPGVAISTADVFAALQGQFGSAMQETLPNWPDTAAFADWLLTQRNDLESPARTIAPVIDDCLATLSEQPFCLLARMSGSGATCFGLFDKAEDAQATAAVLGRIASGLVGCRSADTCCADLPKGLNASRCASHLLSSVHKYPRQRPVHSDPTPKPQLIRATTKPAKSDSISRSGSSRSGARAAFATPAHSKAVSRVASEHAVAAHDLQGAVQIAVGLLALANCPLPKRAFVPR